MDLNAQRLQEVGLTDSEVQLLRLLTTQQSLNEIAQLLEMRRSDVLDGAVSIYRKFGLSGGEERSRTNHR